MGNCPICGEGQLAECEEEMSVEHNGKSGTITLHYSECNVCGSEITDEAQSKANKMLMMAFRDSTHG